MRRVFWLLLCVCVGIVFGLTGLATLVSPQLAGFREALAAPALRPPGLTEPLASVSPKSTTRPQVRAVPVLMYHHLAPKNIASRSKSNVIVTPEVLESHLKYLAKNGYTSITPLELYSHLSEGASLPPKPVLITFDDGYESNYVYGFPLFKKYAMKATIYVITAMIRDDSAAASAFDPAVASHLSWSQVREMAGSGLVSFEPHTHNLHFTDAKRRFGMEVVTPEKMVEDLQTATRLIREHTGQVPISLAYPYGHFRRAYRGALEKAGIKMAFTVRNGHVRRGDNPYELTRMTMHPFYTDLGKVLNPPAPKRHAPSLMPR